jgi:Tannase and feruloyl esterase
MVDIDAYPVTDPFFGRPYLDGDEEVELPAPHRRIHGGFEGTDTRFRFYFPPKEGGGYQGRMFNPLSGGNGGTEDFFGLTELGEQIGGLGMCLRLGGYMVESNQGHIGDVFDPKGGPDPTLYGHRASAEVARFSKHVAAQIYGTPPHHSYVYGGSGGGRRSPLCLENGPDAWDGALPFMGGGDIAEPGNTRLLKGAQNIAFATMFNAQRILGDKISAIVDAVAPGGTGDPFAGLDTHQREELAALYRLGFPRGDEFMIGQQMGQIWLWASQADLLYEQEPDYFDNFWTRPGYVGHDSPAVVAPDLIDAVLTVTRVVTVRDLIETDFAGPEHRAIRTIIQAMGEQTGGLDQPFGIEVPGVGPGYRMGAGVRIVTGKASGRQLYCMGAAGDVFFCDGRGEAGNLRFTDVLPGDEVHVDNHRWLAYCYYTRHHLTDDREFDFLRVDGRPIYPQHPLVDMSPFMGVCYSGQYRGKLMWIHHSHDASLWPPQGVIYASAVQAAQGEGSAARFRLRWNENCEHVPPHTLPSTPTRATNTWLIDYLPIVEQSLKDLVDWVENSIEPAGTTYDYHEGKVSFPASAAQRGGIQPVVSVSATESGREEVGVGEPVRLEVRTSVPPGAGSIVGVEWDFDGSGTFPFRHADIDGTASELTLSTSHTYEHRGTYFATARVSSHRDGDITSEYRRIPNLAQARIIVT